MEKTVGTQPHYDHIQLFRVLACLGVFITHLAPHMGAAGTAARVANFGAAGVYLFFLVSGFLAAGAADIRRGGGAGGVLRYYIKRAFHVLPLYDAVILYNVILHELILRDVPADPAGLSWLRYFLLTNAFIPAPDNFWSNLSATWTVSLFCFFYLCAPAFVKLVGSGSSHQRYLPLRAGILYLAALLLRYVWVAAGLSAYMMAFYYLHFFLLGILVRELAAAYRPEAAACRFAVLAAALGLVLWWSGVGNDYFTVVSWVFAAAVLVTGNFSWEKKKAAPAGGFSQTDTRLAPDGKPDGGMRQKMAGIVGILDAYSYAVYLVHAVVLDGIGMLQAHVRLPGIAVLALAVGLTAAGSWLAHRLIEMPMEKVGKRLAKAIKMR